LDTEVGADYVPGDRVRVRSHAGRGHHRTPWYIKGKVGCVTRVSGPFFNPESRAYGGSGEPKQPLYKVEFSQRDIWGDDYDENRADTVLVDVYQNWLAPVR
jgi:nitrile hydratase